MFADLGLLGKIMALATGLVVPKASDVPIGNSLMVGEATGLSKTAGGFIVLPRFTALPLPVRYSRRSSQRRSASR